MTGVVGSSHLKRIGWKEWVSLPKIGNVRMVAKVDTGAKTSALHVSHIERVPGKREVKFRIHPKRKSQSPSKVIRAPLIEMRRVKSSNGIEMKRPVVRLRLSVGGKEFLTEVTLVNREKMDYRMLLGRQAIKGRFLVDCGHAHLA